MSTFVARMSKKIKVILSFFHKNVFKLIIFWLVKRKQILLHCSFIICFEQSRQDVVHGFCSGVVISLYA